MHILYLTQYYYPEPAEKAHDLARKLVQHGNTVQVLTGFPCYPMGRIYPGYRQRPIHDEARDGVNIIRVPQFPDHSQCAWRRILYYFSFAISATIIGALRVKRCDVIYVYQSALPVGLAGYVLSLFFRKPLIFDVVDLWPESVMVSGMLQNRLAMRMVDWMSGCVYRKADFLCAVTEGYRKRLNERGISDDKIMVIHNWMPDETYFNIAADDDLAKEHKADGDFVVMYAGNIGPAQDLRVVIEAAEILRGCPQIKFLLIGDGLEYNQLRERVEMLGLKNVVLLGRRSPEIVGKLCVLADVLLVHLKSSHLADITIPSKTFAYMASGRPVLMAVRGDAEEFVKENGFGISIPPSDAKKMAEAIHWFYHAPRDLLKKMGDAGSKAYREKYCGDVQVAKVETILHRMASAPMSCTGSGGAEGAS